MGRTIRAVGVGVSIILTCGSSFAQAANNSSATHPNLWGGNWTAYVVPSAEFTPFDPSVTWAPIPASPFRYVTGGDPAQLIAIAHLPQGASVELFEMQGCDTTDPGSISASLWSAPQGGGPSTLLVGYQNGGLGTTGCMEAVAFPPAPIVIDNQVNIYYLTAQNSTTDGSTYVTDIKLFYQLNVSPAPAAATFNDVPTTDPAFQYIEALAASGITGGCGAGIYCPDAAVTRRQMAVFLAKALGLYWQF